MKKTIGAVVLLALSLCLCSACAGKDPAASVAIVSADRMISCEAPDGWTDAAGQLTGEASLEAANIDKEEYLAVIAEQKSDFDEDLNLQGYHKIVVDHIESAAENVQTVSEEKTEINGNAAFLTRLSASVEDTEITYFVCAEEWPEQYVQVVAWTSAENADERADELLSVIRSVRQEK